MDRREFLKKAIQAGGLAALYRLGVTPDQARAWGVFPVNIMKPAISPSPYWSGWDETAESGLSADQDADGNEDTFVAFMENPANGGDETGQGGDLAGADLVLSHAGGGSIDGAVGDPPTRTIDADNEYFTCPQAMLDIMAGQNTWTFITKLTNCNPPAANHGILRVSGGTNDAMYIRSGAGSNDLYVYIDDAGVNRITATTADNWTVNIPVWFFAQSDGSTTVAGWSHSKPTSLAAIAAGQKVSFAGAVTFDNFSADKFLYYDSGNVKAIRGDAYYVIFSKIALIGA